MEPLIITSADPRIPTGIDGETDIIFDEAVRAYEAGAAIIHLHLVFLPSKPGEYISFDVPRSVELINRVREACPDAIIQVGKTTATNESRLALMEAVDIDMLSMSLSDNDKYDTSGIPANHRERGEFEELARICNLHGVMPELEVFHAGGLWNLLYLQSRELIRAPYWVNVCMYHEGGGWSPRTMQEVDYRVAMLPEGANWSLTVFAHPQKDFIVQPTTPDEHTQLLTYAILKGGHIRTGREDRPEYSPGVPVENNAQLVRKMVEIATLLGRPIATPADARRILELDRSTAAK